MIVPPWQHPDVAVSIQDQTRIFAAFVFLPCLFSKGSGMARAVFFDNDTTNVLECRGVKGVVAVKIRESNRPLDKWPGAVLRKFSNEGIAADASLLITSRIPYDTHAGLRKSHFESASRHIKRDTTEVVAIDWDRTITHVEGVLIPASVTDWTPSLFRGAMEVYCGGAERLAMLKREVAALHKVVPRVLVLTANAAPVESDTGMQLFKGLLHHGLGWKDAEIISTQHFSPTKAKCDILHALLHGELDLEQDARPEKKAGFWSLFS